MGAAIKYGVGVSGSQDEEEGAGGRRGNGETGCAVVAVVAVVVVVPRGPPADGRQSGIVPGIVPGRDRRSGRGLEEDGLKAVLAYMEARGMRDGSNRANYC
jgi:hypothetical protein